MAKNWYIIHTYSGYEKKIERVLRRMMDAGELPKEVVFDVEVPAESVVEVRDGKKKSSTRLLLPGYIMLEMDLPELGWERVCSDIRGIDGVTGFVGTSTRLQRPTPISSDEAKVLLQKAGEIKGDKTARLKQTFSVGETVKIIEGPFATFTGTVDDVNSEKNRLRVMVGIFGRTAPVEVDLLQVEKV
jgi:transcriptional antiterminator NusG